MSNGRALQRARSISSSGVKFVNKKISQLNKYVFGGLSENIFRGYGFQGNKHSDDSSFGEKLSGDDRERFKRA